MNKEELMKIHTDLRDRYEKTGAIKCICCNCILSEAKDWSFIYIAYCATCNLEIHLSMLREKAEMRIYKDFFTANAKEYRVGWIYAPNSSDASGTTITSSNRKYLLFLTDYKYLDLNITLEDIEKILMLL